MNILIISKLEKLYFRYKEIELILSNVNKSLNKEEFQNVSKEYLKISKIVKYFIDWKKCKKQIKAAKKLLKDIEIKEMAEEEIVILRNHKNLIEKKIRILLLPKDPYNKKSCFVEIRAATGGDEAAIFAGNLFRMYYKYSEMNHWDFNVINATESEKGGFKEVIIKITGKEACKKLKFESGGHRVQRVPETESQGRIHTSTCTVAIMPVVPVSKEFKINSSDLKIDTFRSSGAGGQHVNTTDSAIRITHIPTGHVVECQDERSQHKNKAKALSILSARIHAAELAKNNAKSASIRRNLLGSGERSDRKRTYNFPQNRVTEHGINLTVYRLNEILDGKLDILINPILEKHQERVLSSLSRKKNEY
ncbi:peptide chain release factor 1 [Buchnera aphidicola (Mindarus keteleerifoliae)]|uniref:peptide chain release factor 1 n=1 Tax=Buchnera aphidicola TaxID=9 RepID=UPI0031B6A8D8